MTSWPGNCGWRRFRWGAAIWRCAGLLLVGGLAGCGTESETAEDGAAVESDVPVANEPFEYWEAQFLQVVTRTEEGFETETHDAVRFVPLRSGTVR